VAVAGRRRQADQVIDAVIEYVRLLMTGGPALCRSGRLMVSTATFPCSW